MEAVDMIVNKLPALTWNHINVNAAKLAGIRIDEKCESITKGINGKAFDLDLSADFDAATKEELRNIATGMGSDVTKCFEASGVSFEGSTIASNAEGILTYNFVSGANNGAGLNLVVKENSEATIIMDFCADEHASGIGAVQTKILMEDNSLVKLVQIIRMGDDFTFLNDIGTKQGKGARFELVQIVLSGKKNYLGLEAGLVGEGSSLKTDIGYAVSNSDVLDMNYVARHTGKKSDTVINVNGSLRDNAYKVFRGTIDFKDGCAGSTGSELENVLIIDDGTVNKTVPLILCEEEEVEGSHGATIGRPDEETLFYLGSRGMDEEAALKLLAKAGLDSVAALIPDEELKNTIMDLIKGGEDNE